MPSHTHTLSPTYIRSSTYMHTHPHTYTHTLTYCTYTQLNLQQTDIQCKFMWWQLVEFTTWHGRGWEAEQIHHSLHPLITLCWLGQALHWTLTHLDWFTHLDWYSIQTSTNSQLRLWHTFQHPTMQCTCLSAHRKVVLGSTCTVMHSALPWLLVCYAML